MEANWFRLVKRFFDSLKKHKEIRELNLSNDTIKLQAHRIFTDTYNGAKIDNYVYGIYLKEHHQLIGFCDLRNGDQAALRYLGNIGYSIFANHRGHNYAYQATLLLFKLAEFIEMDSIVITVNPDNIASIKTIEKMNAIKVKQIPVPADEPLFNQGDYEKIIYRIKIPYSEDNE